MVKTDYKIPQVRREMFGLDSADTNDYNGYDRFGRITKNAWYNGTNLRDRFNHAYDYAGNRLTKDIPSSLISYLDYAWEYDGLNRLKQHEQGTLTDTTITSNLSYRELWTLDQLGNWSEFKTASGGGWLLQQARYHNAVNEIDGNGGDSITVTGVGANWADPAYDAAGNMASIPRVEDEGVSLQLYYDAWNRLVGVYVAGDIELTRNEYDGLGRRIVRAANTESDIYDYYYNEDWQLLEKRLDGSSNPLNQYIWHPY
jgi:hypothetical protein